MRFATAILILIPSLTACVKRSDLREATTDTRSTSTVVDERERAQNQLHQLIDEHIITGTVTLTIEEQEALANALVQHLGLDAGVGEFGPAEADNLRWDTGHPVVRTRKLTLTIAPSTDDRHEDTTDSSQTTSKAQSKSSGTDITNSTLRDKESSKFTFPAFRIGLGIGVVALLSLGFVFRSPLLRFAIALLARLGFRSGGAPPP